MARNQQAARFHAGTLTDGWRWFGAHPAERRGAARAGMFRVWAPNARSVSVVGEFNDWDPGMQPPEAERMRSGRASCRACEQYDLL